MELKTANLQNKHAIILEYRGHGSGQCNTAPEKHCGSWEESVRGKSTSSWPEDICALLSAISGDKSTYSPGGDLLRIASSIGRFWPLVD